LPRADEEGPACQPYVSATKQPAELTLRSLILGAILGIVFAASSVYPALKIGLTVSASIPIAVLAVVGPIADSDLFALLIFFGLGAVLYRVAHR
jgi:hypothetical protein